MDLSHPVDTPLTRFAAHVPGIEARARALDAADGALPEQDVEALAQSGLLRSPFPPALGGLGWDGAEAFDALRLVGRASLPLGRLFEGHVNAVRLIGRHGSDEQRRAAAQAAARGRLFGVWNTETPAVSLRLEDGTLRGGKVWCSGVGLVELALVTARRDDAEGERRQMVLVPLPRHTQRADLSAWTPTGMRASATGTIDLDGIVVGAEHLLGMPDGYLAEPDFSSGAWRFLAVQLGGMEAIAETLREHLLRTGRGKNPHQAARFGTALAAVETARLWVSAAAMATERPGLADQHLVAYVGLARGVVERAALELIEAANRSVGLQGFLRPHPLERQVRDLTTYLRQPAPDLVWEKASLTGLGGPVGTLWR